MSTSLEDMKGQSGAELIRIERTRQLEDLGYDAQHDDSHVSGELVTAAICHALAASNDDVAGADWLVRGLWPFTNDSEPTPAYDWRGRNERLGLNNLIAAGALIAAEIDRRLRRLNGGES